MTPDRGAREHLEHDLDDARRRIAALESTLAAQERVIAELRARRRAPAGTPRSPAPDAGEERARVARVVRDVDRTLALLIDASSRRDPAWRHALGRIREELATLGAAPAAPRPAPVRRRVPVRR